MKSFSYRHLQKIKTIYTFNKKTIIDLENDPNPIPSQSLDDREYIKRYEAYIKKMKEEQVRRTYENKRKLEEEMLNGKRLFLHKMKHPEVNDYHEKTNVDAMANGYFLINGTWIKGSVLLFPERYYMWGVTDAHDIKLHTLDILKVIRPKPSYFVIGTGKYMVEFDDDIYQYFLDELKIKLEIMPTFEAITQFNLSNEDDLSVAAALISHNL